MTKKPLLFAILFLVFVLIGAGLFFLLPSSTEDTGVARAENAIIVSISGLRPDALEQARTPYLDELINQGAYSSEATAVMPSLTLPNHTSMVTSVLPAKHGTDWDEYDPLRGKINVPSIFDLAKRNGLSTLLLAGEPKLEHLSREGIVDHFILEEGSAAELATRAREALTEHLPRVALVHFKHAEIAGHSFGWMSPQQLTAIEEIDRGVAQIVLSLVDLKRSENTLVIITADHGGHDLTHGTDESTDLRIPWIAVGSAIPAGSRPKDDPRTVDTAATVAAFLGLTPPAEWEWKGRAQSFEPSKKQ
jgi:predicted AlkP superfamily pyrophosphatase or phosphodiesterase